MMTAVQRSRVDCHRWQAYHAPEVDMISVNWSRCPVSQKIDCLGEPWWVCSAGLYPEARRSRGLTSPVADP